MFYIHPGDIKLYIDLRLSYWWPYMKKKIALFVEWCLTYRKVKVGHQRYHGMMHTLTVPMKWLDITIVFFMKLPRTTQCFDSIWVIGERLTKSALFILIANSISTKKLVDIYV